MTTKNSTQFGARVISLREAKGMSQADLARAIKVKPPSLSQIEQGRTINPTASTLCALAITLDVDPLFLHSGIVITKLDKSKLAPDEATLVDLYRKLTPSGRDMAMSMLRALQKSAGRKTK